MLHNIQADEVEVVDLVSDANDCQRNVANNPALFELSKSRKVLLLQGPLGPFYDRLTDWLHAGGAEVHRVVFQGGDEYDCRLLTPLVYRGTLNDWPVFFTAQIERLNIDCVVLFGQSRAYHAKALEVMRSRDLVVVVLEEGYFRPGYLTMELGGVNGYSTTMERYRWQPLSLVQSVTAERLLPGKLQPDMSPRHFQKMAWHATKHYAAMHRRRLNFPNYLHHRADDPYLYFAYWLRSWSRKLLATSSDYRFQAQLSRGAQNYFFVPLQHDGDAQITHHSPYKKNTDFIVRVMRSFASHAPSDAWLVFRQHPHSRGGLGDSSFIFALAGLLGLGNRVHHMVEGDTPDLVEQSAGVVLINSTVGLQALERGAPLIALGEALYRRAKLTFSGDLNDFWHQAKPADKAATVSFLTQLKNLTQASGSLYAERNEPIRWRLLDSTLPSF